MKTGKIFTLLFLSFCIPILAFTQAPKKKLKEALSYTYSQSEGTNASSVAWNPKQNMYYTFIAGNESFPLETFNSKGNSIGQFSTMADARGLWYNPTNEGIEGNGAGEAGWFQYDLSEGGSPNDIDFLEYGEIQPDFNAIGTYNNKENLVVFYAEGEIYRYQRKDFLEISSVSLKNSPCSIDELNSTSLGYTGVTGYEYVVLEFDANKLHYFNVHGAYQSSASFPKNAPAGLDRFCFAFTNKMAWLYDKDARTWKAYKAF